MKKLNDLSYFQIGLLILGAVLVAKVMKTKVSVTMDKKTAFNPLAGLVALDTNQVFGETMLTNEIETPFTKNVLPLIPSNSLVQGQQFTNEYFNN